MEAVIQVTENILWNRGASGIGLTRLSRQSDLDDSSFTGANGTGMPTVRAGGSGYCRGPKGQVCGVKMYGNNYRFTVSDNWSGEFAAIQGTRLTKKSSTKQWIAPRVRL